MPQILALPLGFLGSNLTALAGGGVAAQATVGAAFANLSPIIVGLGLTVGLSALFRPEIPAPQSGQIETKQSVPERVFFYGRNEVSGPLGFWRKKTGTSILYKIVLISDGRIGGYETIKLDDIICTVDPVTHYVTNAFVQDAIQRVQIYTYDGLSTQVAEPDLITAFPGIWTADHKLQNIAYVIVVMHGVGETDFIGAYPNGEPQLKVVALGRRLWDPRDASQSVADPATFVFSDNAGLCILDWLTIHPKGYQIPLARLDLPSFTTFANRCDEGIPLNTGGIERRYRVATRVSLKEPRTQVLARLREACDAHLYITSAGKWAIRGGTWQPPNVTISAANGHLLDLEMHDGQNALSRYNELAIRFLSPNNNYAEGECDAWRNEADAELIAGKVKTRDLDLLQVPSFTQARRLAKLMTAFDNPKWIGNAQTNFYGLNAIGEPNVTLNWSEAGEANDGPFWIEPGLTAREDLSGVSCALRSCDPAAYLWYPGTEEGAAIPILPPEDASYTEGVPPANPASFTVTGGARLATVDWTTPSPATDYWLTRIWRALHYTNALRYSEEADNAVWARTAILAFGAGSVANTTAVLDPVGTNTADFLCFDTTTGTKALVQSVATYSPNQTSTYARWYKYQAGGPSWVRQLIYDASAASNLVACYFDIQNGIVGSVTNGGAGSGAAGEIIMRPDGWCCCILHGKPNTAGTQTGVQDRPATANGTPQWTGDGVHGVYVWRGQLEPGSIAHFPLIKTTSAAAAHTDFANAQEVSGPRYKRKNEAAGNAQQWIDRVVPGTYDYYLTVENPIGDRSTPLGPQHVTVTSI